MSPLLPFLYQTRTLARSSPRSILLTFNRLAHSRPRHDHNIPFDWDPDDSHDFTDEAPTQPSTITPSEAEVFKGIFDEIAQGKVPAKRTPDVPAPALPDAQPSPQAGMARSIVEQARVTEFREKFLTRYPKSLRNAAQVALGLYELEPAAETDSSSAVLEIEEADRKRQEEERAKYDLARATERERVDALMAGCATDAALWKVMEKEVFSLPERLGITDKVTKRARKTKSKKASTPEDEKRIMDVHGPLYPHYISYGLSLLETAFTKPSPYIFKVLPRIKELGLPSYVLGVSTPFYARLARIHWERFGDATSALDVIDEMHSTGLYPDEELGEFLAKMRDHLHGCNWGAQGAFVMAMMDSPPYDGGLTQRLETAERRVRSSLLSLEA